MSLADLTYRMSITPTQIGRYGGQGGQLKAGEVAHCVVIDPTATWRVDRDRVQSKSRNTPFHGMELPGVITDTLYKGSWSHREGKVGK